MYAVCAHHAGRLLTTRDDAIRPGTAVSLWKANEFRMVVPLQTWVGGVCPGYAGYAFMSLATLLAAPAFEGGRLATWLRWLFTLHSGLGLIPLVFPALPAEGMDAAGSVDVGTLANLFRCVYFLPVAILLAVFFGQRSREATAMSQGLV